MTNKDKVIIDGIEITPELATLILNLCEVGLGRKLTEKEKINLENLAEQDKKHI